MQTSVSVGQDGRFHQMSACQKKWMEMRTPSSFLHYCSLFQPPRLFLFTQQRTENTHISKEIVSYFWQDITTTQTTVLIFRCKLLSWKQFQDGVLKYLQGCRLLGGSYPRSILCTCLSWWKDCTFYKPCRCRQSNVEILYNGKDSVLVADEFFSVDLCEYLNSYKSIFFFNFVGWNV